jgi:hypothetical protein
MSVISTVEAIPSRLKMLYAFLEGKAGEDRSRLMSIAGPKAFANAATADESSAATVRNSILEALNMGLLIEDNDRISARPLDKATRRTFGFDRAYLQLVEWLLFDRDAPGQESQRAFAFALSWLLTQSPRRPLNFSINQKMKLQEQLGEADDYQLTNFSNWQNLCYWGRYLGYCMFLGLKGVTWVVPDPSIALRRHFDVMLPDKDRMRVADVVSELAERNPVFEGGYARVEVESRFSKAPREQNRLSESTSLGILRLEQQGLIRLEALADADVLSLDLGDTQRAVTHVVRTKAL